MNVDEFAQKLFFKMLLITSAIFCQIVECYLLDNGCKLSKNGLMFISGVKYYFFKFCTTLIKNVIFSNFSKL